MANKLRSRFLLCCALAAFATSTGAAATVNSAAVHDMNGDGTSDLVIRNSVTGELEAWAVSSSLSVTPMFGLSDANGPVQPVPVAWHVVGTGDLTGDGYADLVWQHDDGSMAMWSMRGTFVTGTSMLSIPTVGSSGWRVRAVGDVNGDGRADLIWQNTANGGLAVWLMNGATVVKTLTMTDSAGTALTMPDPNWLIVGAGDINQDGKADIIWQNQATGGLGAWLMNGSVVGIMSNLTPDFINTDYKIRGVGDVNGDGVADLIWVRQSTGGMFVWCMKGFNATLYQGALMIGDNHDPAALRPDWIMVGPG